MDNKQLREAFEQGYQDAHSKPGGGQLNMTQSGNNFGGPQGAEAAPAPQGGSGNGRWMQDKRGYYYWDFGNQNYFHGGQWHAYPPPEQIW